MNLPIHSDNLLPRGKQVGKYIHIRHRVYGVQQVEIWKRFIGPYYLWQETRIIKNPTVNRK